MMNTTNGTISDEQKEEEFYSGIDYRNIENGIQMKNAVPREDPSVLEAKKDSMDSEEVLKFINIETMVVPTTFPTTKTKDFSINTAINSCGFLFMLYYLLKKLNSLQSINSS